MDEVFDADLPSPPTVRIPRTSGRTRRPIAARDRQRLREAIAELRHNSTPAPKPVFRHLDVHGITGDTRAQNRARARILVAHRIAAGGRPLSHSPTDDGLTLGIAGSDADTRIKALHKELKRIGKRRWTLVIHQPDDTTPAPSNPEPA